MSILIARGGLLLIKNDDTIRWVTINGKHIPIRNGNVAIIGQRRVIRTLHQIEKKIRRKKIEHGYIVDQNGKIIWESTGSSDYIDAETAVINNLLSGNYFTHNHPRGLSFSPEDVFMMLKYNIKQIRAVTSHHVFEMTTNSRTKLTNKELREIVKVINKYGEAIYKKANEDNTARLFGAKIENQDYYHELWSRVSRVTKISYRRRDFIE